MIRVKFNDKDSMQAVDFKNITPDVVEIKGKNIPKSNAGFKAYNLNGSFLGDYSAYTQIVAEGKDFKRFQKNVQTA